MFAVFNAFSLALFSATFSPLSPVMGALYALLPAYMLFRLGMALKMKKHASAMSIFRAVVGSGLMIYMVYSMASNPKLDLGLEKWSLYATFQIFLFGYYGWFYTYLEIKKIERLSKS